MKILALENDPKEFSFIQQVLNSEKYTLVNVSSSEQAWESIRDGESRFLIANWDTSDIKAAQLIRRIRTAKLAGPVYILLITANSLDEGLAPTQADDVLLKPFKLPELKTRVAVGERIVSLTNNLAMARDQLESQAMIDTLTGFMNRAAFLRQAAGELERARRSSIPMSLISLDIDQFKSINDSFGSEVGDDILRTVAQIIREKSRSYDYIGRWSGDEFVIMVSGVIGADAEKIAERIVAGVRNDHIEVMNGAPIVVKVSAGVASIARISASTEVEPLIQQARQATARAKEAGGNQVFLVYA